MNKRLDLEHSHMLAHVWIFSCKYGIWTPFISWAKKESHYHHGLRERERRWLCSSHRMIYLLFYIFCRWRDHRFFRVFTFGKRNRGIYVIHPVFVVIESTHWFVCRKHFCSVGLPRSIQRWHAYRLVPISELWLARGMWHLRRPPMGIYHWSNCCRQWLERPRGIQTIYQGIWHAHYPSPWWVLPPSWMLPKSRLLGHGWQCSSHYCSCSIELMRVWAFHFHLIFNSKILGWFLGCVAHVESRKLTGWERWSKNRDRDDQQKAQEFRQHFH